MLRRRVSGRRRALVACIAAALVLGPVVWLWWASLVPDVSSVTDMGYPDGGGGPIGGSHDHGDHAAPADAAHGGSGARSVTSLLADPSRPADVSVTLTARRQRFALASGRTVDGYTLNGVSPGPVIRAVAGQLVQVRLLNESVPDGVTLHWHGVDVPNAEDGVAGVTQDAVGIGQEHTYRFVARQVGTFWYHSHQVSHVQVQRGLLGALVIATADGASDVVDVVALSHLYGGARTVNGQERELRVAVPSGRRTARIRVINTDNGQTPVWVSGAPYRILAVDGTDLTGPTPVRDQYVLVAAGGRVDLGIAIPADGTPVRVQIAGADVVLGGGPTAAPSASQPATAVDLLSYGRSAPLAFDPERPDRTFRFDIGRRPAFLDGRPGVWWTVNGHLFPDVPMFVVSEGDVVRVQLSNHSGDAHPMHLHGHHAVVLARNGVPATGSPWWVDSLTVGNGETYDVTFVADNPGIWMDHCHNLVHAAEGLLAHLMYAGVTTPFVIGGHADNDPE